MRARLSKLFRILNKAQLTLDIYENRTFRGKMIDVVCRLIRKDQQNLQKFR